MSPTSALFILFAALTAHAQERQNLFNDPFQQVTTALPGCPVPEAPLVTQQEAREEAHGRVERGTSCFLAGVCRLPNSYLYDREIIPRVAQTLLHDARFSDTSVWIMGQRRWVYLKGCVSSAQQAAALAEAVRKVDEVEAVVNQLMVGVSALPPYRIKAE